MGGPGKACYLEQTSSPGPEVCSTVSHREMPAVASPMGWVTITAWPCPLP